MPLLDSGDELSLRHLPDASDTSFSFQIPGTTQNENLLAEVDLDFFRGADLSVTAPTPSVLPPSSAHGPLTFSQLTPRPFAEKAKETNNSRKPFPTLSWQPSEDSGYQRENVEPKTRHQRPELKLNTNSLASPKPKINLSMPLARLPSAEGSPVGVRLEVPSLEVEVLKQELPVEASADNNVPLAAHDDRKPKGIRRRSLEKKQMTIREKPGVRNRQKLIEGGINKMRRTSTNKMAETAVRAVRGSILTQPADPAFPSSRQPARTDELNGDEPSLADTSVTSSLGGVAARLLQYGQQLVNSFGADTSAPANLIPSDMPQPSVPVSQDLESAVSGHLEPAEAKEAEEDDRSKPLTLSQLSPRKAATQATGSRPPTPPANEPMSPLRPSTKRPIPMAVASERHIRKKSKGDATSAAETAPRKLAGSGSRTHPKPQLPATRRNPRPANLSRSGSSSGPSSKPGERGISKAKSRVVSLPKPPPAFKPEWNDNVAAKSSSTSAAQSRISRSQSNLDSKATMRPANSLRDKGKGLTTSASSSSSSRLGAKPVFGDHATAAFDATKLAGSKGPSKAAAHERHEQETAEFQASKSQSRSQSHSRSRTRSQTVSQSQSQSQSHSRSTSSQSQREKRYQFYHPVPDFKAIHATQEAELARLKENIHPTVPLSMVLETDVRAEERRKFDEKLKEKERELQRQEEERRRQRELEEEREVRELRKRTVPKAHEIPEWYNEMPKRKNRAQ